MDDEEVSVITAIQNETETLELGGNFLDDTTMLTDEPTHEQSTSSVMPSNVPSWMRKTPSTKASTSPTTTSASAMDRWRDMISSKQWTSRSSRWKGRCLTSRGSSCIFPFVAYSINHTRYRFSLSCCCLVSAVVVVLTTMVISGVQPRSLMGELT